jgi:hypothetical protein
MRSAIRLAVWVCVLAPGLAVASTGAAGGQAPTGASSNADAQPQPEPAEPQQPVKQADDRTSTPEVLFEIEYPSGVKGGPGVADGQNLAFPEGTRLKLFVEDCECTATLEGVWLKDRDTIDGWTPDQKTLPVVLVSGGYGGVVGSGPAVVRWSVTPKSGPKSMGNLSVASTRAESSWSIGDSVAYAVTRRTGNTAIGNDEVIPYQSDG